MRKFVGLFLCGLFAFSLVSCATSEHPKSEPEATSTALGTNLSASTIDEVLSNVDCSKTNDELIQLPRLENVPLQGATICIVSDLQEGFKPHKFVGNLGKLSEALQAENPDLTENCAETNAPLLGVWVLDSEGNLFQAYIPNDGCANHLNDWINQNLPPETLEKFD